MNIEPESSPSQSGDKPVEPQVPTAPAQADAGAMPPPASEPPSAAPGEQSGLPPDPAVAGADVNSPADEMLTDISPALQATGGDENTEQQPTSQAEEEEEEEEPFVPAEPLEFIDESQADEDLQFDWYILKVAVNREDSIKEALLRKVRMNGLERYFREVVVPTEDVAEFTKTGKRRVVKKKIYPGYILVNMSVNDESWFIVRETPGIGDFTGAAGKPAPMDPKDVERILRSSKVIADEEGAVKTAIPFKTGDRVRVKEGYFQNFEGDVDAIDQANGRVTVMINIFGRSTPVELEHWQIEMV